MNRALHVKSSVSEPIGSRQGNGPNICVFFSICITVVGTGYLIGFVLRKMQIFWEERVTDRNTSSSVMTAGWLKENGERTLSDYWLATY